MERLPRDKAIDGIHAFNELRYVLSVLSFPCLFKITNNETVSDDLIKFLRPFAQEGKVVNESDVTDFFATLMEASKTERN